MLKSEVLLHGQVMKYVGNAKQEDPPVIVTLLPPTCAGLSSGTRYPSYSETNIGHPTNDVDESGGSECAPSQLPHPPLSLSPSSPSPGISSYPPSPKHNACGLIFAEAQC